MGIYICLVVSRMCKHWDSMLILLDDGTCFAVQMTVSFEEKGGFDISEQIRQK
jgi:hypothetical protein